MTAALPPPGLPGLDPAWSRLVTDARGHTWHVLDTGRPTHGTLVCVHGNPTWSYLWRRHLAAAPPGWRVIAVDQLGMGFSARLPAPRTLAERVADLDAVLTALEVTGPVVTAGHDWGGAISLGWALQVHAAHRDLPGDATSGRGTCGAADLSSPRLCGVVLANTAVHQPAGSPAPALIRLARTPALRHAACAATPTFVRATSALSRPPLPRPVRDALAAPYGSAARRRAVEEFVADIPLEPDHPSAATLDGIAEGVRKLDDVPVLLLWGPRDPVFSDRYLRDLRARLPHADVQRYERASHLVTEDVPEAARDTWTWIAERVQHTPEPPRGHVTRSEPAPEPPHGDMWRFDSPSEPPHGHLSRSGDLSEQPHGTTGRSGNGDRDVTASPAGTSTLWVGWEARADDPSPAVVEPGGRTISWTLFARRVHELVVGLADHGVAPGDRVALLVPPGADLTAAAHACWRAGASVVVADPGLGAAGLARALRGAHPAHVIGGLPGLALAAALQIPGSRIAAARPPGARRLLGSPVTLAALARRGRALLDGGVALPPEPEPDAEAAVLFTSGATGPAKGVVYRHHQAGAQIAALRGAYGITDGDRLVAAFPPFALYGPALGIAAAVPDAPRPGALTAAALADAVAAVAATMVFASPAALRNVVATAEATTPAQRRALAGVRRVVSAGAPVPASLLHALTPVLPHAAAHTPYGMTEALPVTDVALDEIDAAGPGNGVCVGRPLPGVDVTISPLNPSGVADGSLTRAPGVAGEISIAAPHVKDRYDQLWAVQRASARDGHSLPPGGADSLPPGGADSPSPGDSGSSLSPGGGSRHRTGDVGHLDDEGRLWVEGRLVHVITTADGPVTPVGIEQRVEAVDGVRAAAAVGVGPVGTQQVVVVVVPRQGKSGATARRRAAPLLAAAPLTDAVRAAAARSDVGVPIAAVLVADRLPVDIRHAAKIDRARVARWAERVLSGSRAGRRP